LHALTPLPEPLDELLLPPLLLPLLPEPLLPLLLAPLPEPELPLAPLLLELDPLLVPPPPLLLDEPPLADPEPLLFPLLPPLPLLPLLPFNPPVSALPPQWTPQTANRKQTPPRTVSRHIMFFPCRNGAPLPQRHALPARRTVTPCRSSCQW
jgi:signal-induced proliferation-associated 1 like protein 3